VTIQNLEIVHMFSDSCDPINAVNRRTSTVRPDTYRSLLNLRQLLYNMNIRVLLIKIQDSLTFWVMTLLTEKLNL